MSSTAEEMFQRAAGILRIAEQRMLQAYPFHARFLAQWQHLASTAVATMGVTIRNHTILLLYNPSFVLRCSFAELAAVLHHECNHLLFGHLFLAPTQFADHRALTIAEEVTANEFIREPLPGNPVLLQNYPALPPHEDTLARYARLVRQGPDQKQPSEVPKNAPRVPKNPGSVPNSDIAEPILDTPQTIDDHSVWAEARAAGQMGALIVRATAAQAAESLSLAEWQALPKSLRHQVAGIGAGAGTARLAGGQGNLDWRVILRRYIREATEVRPVFNRSPRRFPDLIGIIPAQTRAVTKPIVMAVIDTSGSMTRAILNLIAGELDRLAKNHRVTIVECDAAVHRVYPYQGRLEMVYGRGGTDLRPPFAMDLIGSLHPDVLVYFTDGHGPAPMKRPTVPVVWCLTPGGSEPAPWGRVVWLSLCDSPNKNI